MVSSNGNGNGGTRVRSLRELPQEIAPPRDLWPAIEARIQEEMRRAAGPGRGAGTASRLRPSRTQLVGLAAVVAALAVGILIGRSLLPVGTGTVGEPPIASAPAGRAESVPAAFVTDPRYLRQRAALVRDLEARLEALPPESQAKVVASLTTIRQSIRDLEAALGRDPSNALLQELLVNTYQDEMRVLTTVHQAGWPGEEI